MVRVREQGRCKGEAGEVPKERDKLGMSNENMDTLGTQGKGRRRVEGNMGLGEEGLDGTMLVGRTDKEFPSEKSQAR